MYQAERVSAVQDRSDLDGVPQCILAAKPAAGEKIRQQLAFNRLVGHEIDSALPHLGHDAFNPNSTLPMRELQSKYCSR